MNYITYFYFKGLENVLIAGIYHEKNPEDVNHFLCDCCDDIGKLAQTRMHFSGKLIKVSLRGLSSDAQSTSFALCIKSHTAYFG